MTHSPAPGEGKSNAGLYAVLLGLVVVAAAAASLTFVFLNRGRNSSPDRLTAPMPKLAPEDDERGEKAKPEVKKPGPPTLPMPKPAEGE